MRISEPKWSILGDIPTNSPPRNFFTEATSECWRSEAYADRI